MILTTIKDAGIYRGISIYLASAIDWIQEHFGDNFVKGVYGIDCPDGTKMTVKCIEPAYVAAEEAVMEAHKRFIDIQIPLKVTETMGWSPIEAVKQPRADYNEEKDVIKFYDASQCLFPVEYGQMAIFFPDDAHTPNIGQGEHLKLVVKVPVA